MNVRVSDRFELKGDPTQWQVIELREVEDRETGAVEQKWVPLQSYHGSIGSALRWVSDYAVRTEVGQVDVEGYLEELGKLAKQVSRCARSMERAAKAGLE